MQQSNDTKYNNTKERIWYQDIFLTGILLQLLMHNLVDLFPYSLFSISTTDNNFGTLIPSCIFILAFEIIGNFTGRDLKRLFSP